jgi:hypothetical protein
MPHYYDQKGNSVYTVPRVDGKGERDTTLRDAKKLKLVPSVTTITGIPGKDMLGRWKQIQLLNMVERYPNMVGKSEDWKDQLIAMSDQENSKYAKRGNEIHNALETYFKTGEISEEEIIIPVVEFLQNLFEKYDNVWYEAEKSFAHSSGYGGKVDLVVHTDVGIAIIDFKTKQGDKLDGSKVYDDYCMQLAAYREPLRSEVFMCANLLISVTHPGVFHFEPWSDDKLDNGFKAFEGLHQYWKVMNNYDSGFPEIQDAQQTQG